MYFKRLIVTKRVLQHLNTSWLVVLFATTTKDGSSVVHNSNLTLGYTLFIAVGFFTHALCAFLKLTNSSVVAHSINKWN